jgi:hypothetical protein
MIVGIFKFQSFKSLNIKHEYDKNKRFRKRSDIHIWKVAQFDKPVLLFLVRKDSITLVRLAQSILSCKIPSRYCMSIQVIISLKRLNLEIAWVKLGLELIVRNVQDAIDEGKVVEQVSILAEIVFKPLRFGCYWWV